MPTRCRSRCVGRRQPCWRDRAGSPQTAAFTGWVSASFVPYLGMMRAIVGRNFGWLLAIAFPMVFNNTLVGQNGFLTAALIGGTLYLIPVRPILAGVCLGLLTYKPQYGLLFPIVLIAASQWTVFFTAAVVAVGMAFASWLAFGTEPLAWAFQWVLTASVAVVLALMWRSRIPYTLKAAALACGSPEEAFLRLAISSE
jgi:hypothetical protein